MCHAINAGNLSSELMCLSNIEEFLTFQLLPILPHLLDKTCRYFVLLMFSGFKLYTLNVSYDNHDNQYVLISDSVFIVVVNIYYCSKTSCFLKKNSIRVIFEVIIIMYFLCAISKACFFKRGGEENRFLICLTYCSNLSSFSKRFKGFFLCP